MSSSRIVVFLAVLVLAGSLRAADGSADVRKSLEWWSGATWSDGEGAAIARLLSHWVRHDPEIRQSVVVELADGSTLRLGFAQGDPSPRVMRLGYLDVRSGWEAELEIDTLLLDEKEEAPPTVEQIVEAQRAGTLSTRYALSSSDGFRVEAEDPRELPGVEQVRRSLEEIFAPALEAHASERTPIPDSAANGLRALVMLSELGEERASPLASWANALRLFRAVFTSPGRGQPRMSATADVRLRSAMKPTLSELHATEVGREIRDLKLPPPGGD